MLNIAEAAGVINGRKKAQFLIARGSAVEAVAAYELAEAHRQRVPLDEVREQARVIVAMLTKLSR